MFKEEGFLKMHCLTKHQSDLESIKVKLSDELMEEIFFNNYCKN